MLVLRDDSGRIVGICLRPDDEKSVQRLLEHCPDEAHKVDTSARPARLKEKYDART